MSAPPIDNRDYEKLLNEILQLIPFYTPEWKVYDQKDPGMALLKIFATMFEGVINRINQVPNKNFIAFLNMLGVKLLPAQQARAPVTFKLSEGATEPVPIPAGTQVVSNPPDGSDPIIFETEKNIVATPAQIKVLISYIPSNDKIVDLYKDLRTAQSEGIFSNSSINLQEHSIYFGHDEMLNLKQNAVINIRLVSMAKYIPDLADNLSWEWWHKDHWVPSTIQGFRDPVSGFNTYTSLVSAEQSKLYDEGIVMIVTTDIERDARFPVSGLLLIEDPEVNSKGCVIIQYEGKKENKFLNSNWTSVYQSLQGDKVINSLKELNDFKGAKVRVIDYPLIVSKGKKPTDITLKKHFNLEFAKCRVNGEDNIWIRCRAVGDTLLKDTGLQNLIIHRLTGQSVINSETKVAPDALFYNDVPLEINSYIYPFGKIPRTYDSFYIASRDALSKRGAAITINFEIVSGGASALPVSIVQGIGPTFAGRLAGKVNNLGELLEKTPEDLMFILGETKDDDPDTIVPISKKRAQNILEAAWKEFYDKTGNYMPGYNLYEQMDVVLSWEYWNGVGWQVIPELTGEAKSLIPCGNISSVKFICPQDIKNIKINGLDNYWIRIRIVHGDYGKESYSKRGEEWLISSSKVNPPKIKSINIEYESVSVNFQKVLGYNNLNFAERLRTEEETLLPLKPFEILEDKYRTIYFGFDYPTVKGPTSVYFLIEEQDSLVGNTRIEWQYYKEVRGIGEWSDLGILDDTKDLTQSGIVEFHLPRDISILKLFGKKLYWIRCLFIQINSESNGPKIREVFLNTTWVVQGETFRNKLLGSSSGEANQLFKVGKFPINAEEVWINEFSSISENERTDLVANKQWQVNEVKDENGDTIEFWVRWQSVDDFLYSSLSDRHYTIDRAFGRILFGDGVNGKLPPASTNNIMINYRYGCGKKGNVRSFEITELKTSIAFVDEVYNPAGAVGGADTEVLEQALIRGPKTLRHKNRVVTAEDYEWLARMSSVNVARAKCFPNYGLKWKNQPGYVTVVILPESKEAQPKPSQLLIKHVEKYLLERAANVIADPEFLRVTAPKYVKVVVNARIKTIDIGDVPLVEREALKHINAFLHPLTGGNSGCGWEFGYFPNISDFYALLEGISGVNYVENLELAFLDEHGTELGVIEPYILVTSGEHKIEAFYQPIEN